MAGGPTLDFGHRPALRRPARCTVKKLPLVLALVACLTCATSMAQAVPPVGAWKWRDASGQVNVSDLPPPPTVHARDILERPPVLRTPPAAPPAASGVPVAPALHGLSTPRTDPELDARRKRAQDEQTLAQRQAQERDAAVRTDNCGRARAALALLNDGQRMVRTNAQGEREVIDDKTRAAEVERARAVIASDCR